MYLIQIYLTNRFQVAVRLFSNRSQMMSKYGKNKKGGEIELTSDEIVTFESSGYVMSGSRNDSIP